MKRIQILIAILVCSLLGIGWAATMAATASQAPTGTHHLTGLHGGKIIAIKPPGNWAQGGGPTGTGPGTSRRAPLTLPVFGTDVHVASSNETFIASDPMNPLYFIAGSNAVARAFSSNGGASWAVTSPAGIGDPVGVYDNLGNAYFGQLSTGSCPDPAEVSRSSDGGATWGAQVYALSDASPSDHFIDKEWMTADNTPTSPFYTRIYVTATSFYAPGCNLGAYVNNREVMAYSTNQGANWSAPVTISDASHDQNQFTNPIAASDGTLYISYQYQNCTYNCTFSLPMVQLLTKSTDGGVTFSPSMTITGQPITPTGAFSGGYQYLYAGSTSSGFRHNDQAIIGVSPTNPQHVYAVWTDGRFESTFVYQGITGYHADIVSSRSTDGGATWGPVIKINDDNVQGKDQFFPWMTVGSNGTIHVSWMDRREASVNGFPYREFYSQSTDEGATWSVNQPVGDVVNTPGGFIGDYSGIAVNGNNSRVLPIWTDQRSGQGVYTDAGIISGGSTPTPTSPPANTPSATATAPAATATPCGGGSPTWVAGPTLVPARYAIQGAVGTDGNVYVATGLNPMSTPLPAEMARYNSTSNTWTDVAPPPIAVGEYSEGAMGGKVYVAGGFLGGTTITSTLQIYDIASNTWSFGASMPASVEAGAGIALSGKFYVVGGDDFTSSLRSTYIYDIAGNTWTTGPQIPDTNGRTNTYGTAAGGLVYVFGGAYLMGSTNFPIDTLISYDPGTNTWTTLASAGTGGLGNYGAVSPYGTGKLIATDGGDGLFNPAMTTHIYTISSNTWVAGPSMIQPRLGHAQATLPDGRVLVYSGLITGGSMPTGTTGSELLAPPAVCSTPTATVPPANTATATVPPANTATATVPPATATVPPGSTSTPTFPPANTATPTPPTGNTVTPTTPPVATSTVPPGSTATPTAPPATATATVPPGSTATATATACTINFSDVHMSDYFYVPVQYLYCHGVISGYSDGTFRPYNNTTRSQMVKIVVLGFQKPIRTPAGGAYTFTDVTPANPFYSVIETAAADGIVSGYNCGMAPAGPCDSQNRPYFLPYNYVTRGQLSKIDVIAAGWALYNPPVGHFIDVIPGSVFYTVVETAYCHGVISGYSDRTFRPYNNAIRGQIAKIVYLSLVNPPVNCGP
ncbi:MAG: Kelch repeat-containing protein [Chloroflexia bacterium]